MVLYLSVSRGGKAEKTNWVMHQYHLGTEEDEKDGEYVISKVFYQQQQPKPWDRSEVGCHEGISGSDVVKTEFDPVTPKSVTLEPSQIVKWFAKTDRVENTSSEVFYQQQQLKPGDRSEVGCRDGINDSHVVSIEVDPVTPKYVTPEPSQIVKSSAKADGVENASPFPQLKQPSMEYIMEEGQPKLKNYSSNIEANDLNQNDENDLPEEDTTDHSQDGTKWWYGESQELLDSEVFVEGLSPCDEFLESQSPDKDGNVKEGASKGKPSLSDYARLGPEHFKKDLEECEKFVLDPGNIEGDTPPEFRISQLEFGSQDGLIPRVGPLWLD